MFQRDDRFLIPGPVGALEAVLHQPEQEGSLARQNYCAVVCHPHPLHGGTMDNKVATTLAKSYRELGIPTVRFNFRGVGKSDGIHDDARGEVDDLEAVANWMAERFPDSGLLLAGFSFGSAVAAAGSYRLPAVVHLTLVAPPVDRYHYARDRHFDCPVCVVMGDRDELVDARQVYHWAEGLDPAPAIIRMPEATHFFHGQLVKLRQRLSSVILEALAP